MARFSPPVDAQVFLGRLTHLDPAAVVRLRPADSGRTALWAHLPWGVLVTREVDGPPPGDLTVAAADLLQAGDAEPRRRDTDWTWPLPPSAGTVLEEVPAARLQEVAAAAAGTLREVTRTGLDGRPVGSRVLREALLEHIAVIVETDAGRVEVPQRLVQAIVRMGFLGDGETAPVQVRSAGRWVGLAAPYGTAWLPPSGGLTVQPVSPSR